MGSISRAWGTLLAEPALPESAFVGTKWDGAAAPTLAADLFATNVGDPDTVGLVDGQIRVIPGTQRTEFRVRHDDAYRAEDTPAYVDDAASLCRLNRSKLNGIIWIHADGERYSRVRVVDNEVHHEEPRLMWPNGDEGIVGEDGRPWPM